MSTVGSPKPASACGRLSTPVRYSARETQIAMAPRDPIRDEGHDGHDQDDQGDGDRIHWPHPRAAPRRDQPQVWGRACTGRDASESSVLCRMPAPPAGCGTAGPPMRPGGPVGLESS
jgi:hypothetical protein